MLTMLKKSDTILSVKGGTIDMKKVLRDKLISLNGKKGEEEDGKTRR